MIRRILVGLGGTPYTNAALQTAVELARAHGAELTGVTAVDVEALQSAGPAPIGAEASALELRDHRLEVTAEHVERVIAAFESACAAGQVPYRVHREEGDAFKLMLSHSRYHDLTVFGLRSIFEYYFEEAESSNLLARLVGEGARPILAVAREYRPIRRVLIAYSGSIESAKAMRQFVQLRPWPQATVRIVAFEQVDEDPDRLLADAARYCRAHDVEAETEHAAGSAKDQLLSYAAGWDADLIVLGNSCRSFLLRQLFGETALDAMQNSDLPLFLSQ